MTTRITRPTADKTRADILKAARKLFVKKGFAGTSISDIAGNANINQSLIYHHFGNKEQLWYAVKMATLEQYQTKNKRSLDEIIQASTATEFIEKLVGYRFDLFDKHPDLQRMLEWQHLESKRYQLNALSMDKITAIENCIRTFQKQGTMLKEYNPELILALITTSTLGLFNTYRDIKAGKTKAEYQHCKQQYLNLCVNTLIKGLRPN